MHQNLKNIVLAGVALSAGGCAQQYHWYQGGRCCTPYTYCHPAPLPYTPYHGCPTPIASSYAGHAYVRSAPVRQPNEHPSSDPTAAVSVSEVVDLPTITSIARSSDVPNVRPCSFLDGLNSFNPTFRSSQSTIPHAMPETGLDTSGEDGNDTDRE